MKTTATAALAALISLAAAPALAQDQGAHADHAAHAAATSSGLSVETTPIADLAARPETKAVLDKNIPGLTDHPAFEQFKAMTLKQVQPMSQGALSDDMLAAVQADLDKLPK